MHKSEDLKVCPVEKAGMLDNSFRKLFQNPRKILKPYIRKGMTVLDLGCGPGFFTVEIAKLLDGSGKVIAADLQEGMLAKLNNKISGTGLANLITTFKCQENKIGLTEKVDFVLAFYMVHEVPDQEGLFRELKSIIKSGGNLLVIEPKFHVPKTPFEDMQKRIESSGFEIVEKPRVLISRAVLFKSL